MRIGIEGKVLSRQAGGIGRYAINLVETLVAHKAQQWPDLDVVIFTAPQTDRSFLPESRLDVCERFRQVKSTLLRSGLLLPAGMLLDHIEVFHGLDQSGIPLFGRMGKHVVTIHDVIPLVLPEAFPRRHRLVLATALARIRRQADVVIVPSRAAAEDVIHYLKVEEERLVVIPMGCEPHFRPIGATTCMARLRQRYGLPERYILFVGTLEPRKNLDRLLQAFAQLLREKPKAVLKLVVAGGKGWGGMDYRARAEALGVREHVIFTGFVDEDDLPELYRGALMFVYPSLYEGFGLPILEAMACGTPVITSNRSSLPEIAGDAALLIDPTKCEELAAAMLLLLSDGTRRQELRTKGIRRAGDFTWETVAQQTVAVYRTVSGR